MSGRAGIDSLDRVDSILALADLATPMSIRVAATLSLAERAGSTGSTAQQLASETGTSAVALKRMLDHLVTAGVFDHDPETDRYKPTQLGAQMSEDAPEGVKPLLDMNCAGGRAELAFVDLLGTITTGEPSYPVRYGRDFWSDIDADPKLRTSFDAQMNWRFRAQATQIAERFDWSRYPKILDVGGGDGGLLAAILDAHPSVHGQVLDLAPSAAAAAARFADTDRADAIPGSFFDPLPQGADAYLLSDILHDWDDENTGKILSRCRDAAAANNATVVVVEPLIGSAGTAIDLFMLMCFGGRERTVEELTRLAEENGLTLESASQVSDGRTAMEFTVTGQSV